ncbi:hypothetical protein BH24BAC1_BH24BAC1_08830 [soil metagenome]
MFKKVRAKVGANTKNQHLRVLPFLGLIGMAKFSFAKVG